MVNIFRPEEARSKEHLGISHLIGTAVRIVESLVAKPNELGLHLIDWEKDSQNMALVRSCRSIEFGEAPEELMSRLVDQLACLGAVESAFASIAKPGIRLLQAVHSLDVPGLAMLT